MAASFWVNEKVNSGEAENAIPGGKIDFAEPPFATVMREIKEETNLDLKEIYFTGKVTNDYFPDRGKHYITLYYIAEAVNPQGFENDRGLKRWKNGSGSTRLLRFLNPCGCTLECCSNP